MEWLLDGRTTQLTDLDQNAVAAAAQNVIGKDFAASIACCECFMEVMGREPGCSGRSSVRA
jgi:hypothetical protein